MNNNNPFGNFNSMTPQQRYMMTSGMNNINQSYSQPQQPLIDHTNFKNKGNVLHNNLYKNIQLETTYESEIHINSSDRLTTMYPNMFNFSVSFGVVNTTGNRTQITPFISRSFERVKYIYLEFVSLPKTNVINVGTGSPITYSLSTDHDDELTVSNGFLVLSIEELDTIFAYSTGNLVKPDSFIIVPDRTTGCNHNVWKAIRGKRIYPDSSLKNITKMTLKIKDQYGADLKYYDQHGDVFDIQSTLINLKTQLDEAYDADIQAQYDSLVTVNSQLQVVYMFIFGTCETELHTHPTY